MAPLSSPNLAGFLISGSVLPSTLNPLQESLPIKLPINFADITNVQVITGTYTPNNDAAILAEFSSAAQAPNFVLLMVDGQANVDMQTAGFDIVHYAPISKVLLLTSEVFTSDYITQISINGSTSLQNPMPQGTPVNYTLVFGQAQIS